MCKKKGGLDPLFGFMKKLFLLLFFITGFSSSQTWGADFEKGLVAALSGDYATALKEWTPLAEQGDTFVQYDLGVMYERGVGVPQDYKTAVKWFTRASEQGDAHAQTKLAAMISLGEGVIQDNVYAHMWLNISRANGHKNGNKLIEILVKKMTPSQIEKAQDLARECVKKNYKGC